MASATAASTHEASTPIDCACKKQRDLAHRRYWRVTVRKGRVDAAGNFFDAPLSTVRCFKCKTDWRSRADWLEDLEDARGNEITKDELGERSYKVKHWTGTEVIIRATFFEDDDPCFSLVERAGYYYAVLDKAWSQVPGKDKEPDDFNSWRWHVFHAYDEKDREIAKLEYDGQNLREGKLRGFGNAWGLGDPYHQADSLRGLLVQVAYAEG